MGTDAYIKVIRTGGTIFVDQLKNIRNQHTIETEYLNLLEEGIIKKESLIKMMEDLVKKDPDRDYFYLTLIDEVKAYSEDDTFKLLNENQDEYWD